MCYNFSIQNHITASKFYENSSKFVRTLSETMRDESILPYVITKCYLIGWLKFKIFAAKRRTRGSGESKIESLGSENTLTYIWQRHNATIEKSKAKKTASFLNKFYEHQKTKPIEM